MINKAEVGSFFDRLAEDWDLTCLHDDAKIGRIMDLADIHQGQSVLDVGCGTGVIIPDYLARKVGHITAIDLSAKMIAEAQKKFNEPNIQLIAGDVETWPFSESFDRVMVYNAFPHFPDPQNLIKRLSSLLTPAGRLTIAHGLSRAQINKHHSGSAKPVSLGLMSSEELKSIMSEYLNVDVCMEDESIYVVSGSTIVTADRRPATRSKGENV